jgi:PAS domain S-box-containing protein
VSLNQIASTTSRASERLAFASASAATLLGVVGLLGWITPARWLASLSATSIPMAPSTALAFLLLGGIVMLEARRRARRLTTAVSWLILVLSCVELAQVLAHRSPWFDALLVPAPDTSFGVLAGRMSPFTAVGLLLASLGLVFLGPARAHRMAGTAGTGLAALVCLLGAVVTLGYVFGEPLLYGGQVVPMPLSTALATGCLGLALAGLIPGNSAPLRPFAGASTRARLLRTLLLVATAVLAGEFLADQVPRTSAGLHAALSALLSTFLLAAAASYLARGILEDVDRAQGERERSRGDADRLAAIVESSSDAIYAKNLDGAIIAWNPGAERMFGYTEDQALGRTAILSPPSAEAELAAALEGAEAAEGLESSDVTRTHRDGSQVLVSISRSPLRNAEGQVVGVSVIARDVSEQRRAEAKLRQSEADFRLLTEAMPQIVFMTAPDGSNFYTNQQWTDYTGLAPEESYGQGWNAVFHPDDQQPAMEAWVQATATGGLFSTEARMRRADGAYRWHLVRGVPLRDAEGTILRWCGTCTDIHDLKEAISTRSHAEHRLLASATEYRLMFDENPHPMWVFDAESLGFLAVNDAATKLYGFSREEFLGMTIEGIRPAEEVSALRQYLPSMSNAPSLAAVHVKHCKKDGTVFEVEGVSNPIRFRGRRARLVLAHDISGKRHLEAQLLQAQKMEAVGRLAGGVAHDFNNQLGVIQGYTEILLRHAGEAQRGKLEQILKATQHASGLTRQLLAFSRKQIVSPKVLDLNALVSELEKMLVRLIGEDIDLAIVPGADLGQVEADPGQLEQVVMNLCVNARDAMPEGGLLRIETANVDLDAGHTSRHEIVTPGQYVMLAVSDGGCGMDKETLSRIFEPFFTTKEQGKGTGLGLAMVYGAVKQAGGYVWPYSEPGRGTTFKIYLPRLDDRPLTPAVQDAPPTPRGSETILLVEDEAALRTVVREILEGHGYRVIEAANPAEAIALAERQRDVIHLLVTDVVMPGMNGRALTTALTAVRPELRVLYMSGYTDDVIVHRGVLAPGTMLISKPFTALALLGRVREALAEWARGESA